MADVFADSKERLPHRHWDPSVKVRAFSYRLAMVFDRKHTRYSVPVQLDHHRHYQLPTSIYLHAQSIVGLPPTASAMCAHLHYQKYKPVQFKAAGARRLTVFDAQAGVEALKHAFSSQTFGIPNHYASCLHAIHARHKLHSSTPQAYY